MRDVHFPHRSQPKRKQEGEPTDEVGVIRREFIVQLDGVRFVDGVPERGPASNNGVYVFRIGGPETMGHGGWRVPVYLLADVKTLTGETNSAPA